MKFFIFLFLFANFYNAYALKGTAQLSYYESYPRCCKGQPNYDPYAPITAECNLFIGCKYVGLFAAYPDKKTLDWVKSNDLISFYDASDRNGATWYKTYARKTIKLSKNGKSFTAIIADTCGDNDCGGCCYRNSKGGYLLEMEYYTVLRNLGSLSAASGTIDFEIV